MENFSDYIVYLDESGTSVLNAEREDFPIFVIACILVKKTAYEKEIVPAIQKFKFKYFGHDQIILQEQNIKKQIGEFSFLKINKEIRKNFLNDLSHLIDYHDFEVSICVIDKTELRKKYPNPFDPYKLALLYSMEHLALRLENLKQCGKTIHVIAKSGDKTENKELEFQKIANGTTFLPSEQADLFKKFDWQILFSDKKANSAGLQLADLVAHDIGVSVLQTDKSKWPIKYWGNFSISGNKALEIVKNGVPFCLKAFP